MTISFVDVDLRVTTTSGPMSYRAEFTNGLNVLNARNSWGKSTLLQSMVYALGLEGSFTTSRGVPLGPAMTQHVDTAVGRSTVIDSAITLTIANSNGALLRVRRWPVSQDVDKDLIQVWQGRDAAELADSARTDYFVGRRSVLSDFGFHGLLERFLGWRLPLVPDYSEGDTHLYLETIWPLAYVEQKFGWSGVAPRVPTHYGIRRPVRRAVEYVLGLGTLERARQLDALREEETTIGRAWYEAVSQAHAAAAAEQLRPALLSETPTSFSQRRRAVLEASLDGTWRPASVAREEWRSRLEGLGAEPAAASERTERTRADLSSAEARLRAVGAQVRATQEQLSLAQADEAALRARVAATEADKRRLQDITRLRALGGDFHDPLLDAGLCPTCQQDVDDRDVATGAASTLDSNIQAVDAERVTLRRLEATTADRQARLLSLMLALQRDLQEARAAVRLLRDELVGPSGAPSLVDVQIRLDVEGRLRGLARAEAVVFAVEESLDQLALQLDEVRRRRAELDDAPESKKDEELLGAFRRSFQAQLASYGLRSVRPDEVTVDFSSLLPVSQGFELAFDVANGFSASDSVRTKWAYHTALLEASIQGGVGHHPGLLMLDEPRQQETERTSLAAFLQRLNANQARAQIIYATSEDPATLGELLADIEYNRLPSQGAHLIAVQS